MSEEKKSSETITISKDALWKYSTFFLGAVVLVMALVAFSGSNNDPTGNVVAPSNPSAPTQPSTVEVSIDDDAILGDPDAPLTIIEFSDYQCPFCRKFWSDTLPSIKSQYIDTGKVKFVYRDFPLTSIHPGATPAAEAAECAREIGGDEAYYEMHDKIFEEQAKLGQGTVQYSNTDLVNWANDIGYDVQSCLSSGKFTSEVNADLQDGADAGVRGTPGFFILKGDSGEATPISGAQPFSVFQQVIEANL